MKKYKLFTLLLVLLLTTSSFADYFDDLAEQEITESTGDYSSSTSDYDDNDYIDDSEPYDEYQEQCEKEYRIEKQNYLTAKKYSEKAQEEDKKGLLKTGIVAAVGLVAAVAGHNNGSQFMKDMGTGVVIGSAIRGGFQLSKYYKNGKLEKPTSPYYCQEWDSKNIGNATEGIYCGEVTKYGRDRYGRAIEYASYICGMEEFMEYQNRFDCISCH